MYASGHNAIDCSVDNINHLLTYHEEDEEEEDEGAGNDSDKGDDDEEDDSITKIGEDDDDSYEDEVDKRLRIEDFAVDDASAANNTIDKSLDCTSSSNDNTLKDKTTNNNTPNDNTIKHNSSNKHSKNLKRSQRRRGKGRRGVVGRMRKDLMSELMESCDEYVASAEDMKVRLFEAVSENEELKRKLQKGGVGGGGGGGDGGDGGEDGKKEVVQMEERATSPMPPTTLTTMVNNSVQASLPTTTLSDVLKGEGEGGCLQGELEGELLSMLDHSLATYKLTCHVAAEKVNGRALEHVTGRKRNVLERMKGANRSGVQVLLDLFKLSASSNDLVRLQD